MPGIRWNTMCLYTLLSVHMFVQYKWSTTTCQQQRPCDSVDCKHTQPDNSMRPSNFPITSSLLKWDVRVSREDPTTMRSRKMTGGDGRPVQWGTCQVCYCHCPLTSHSPHCPHGTLTSTTSVNN